MAVQPPGHYTRDAEGYAHPSHGGTLAMKAGVITYEDTTSTLLFTLPRGARLVDEIVEVTSAFDDSGTDLLIVGTSDNDDAYVDDLDVSSAAISRYGDTSVVKKTALQSPLAEDTPVYGKYTGQNSNATDGRAVIILMYITTVDTP